MAKNIDFKNLPTDPATTQKMIEYHTSMADKEIGYLGKFFGSGDSVKVNVSGFCIIVLLAIGIIYTVLYLFFASSDTKAAGIIEFWGIITPIVTLALGYIFGKSPK